MSAVALAKAELPYSVTRSRRLTAAIHNDRLRNRQSARPSIHLNGVTPVL
jgi:hypothetical protein